MNLIGFAPFLVELRSHRGWSAWRHSSRGGGGAARRRSCSGRRRRSHFNLLVASFFLVFWLIVGVGRWVLILINLFFLVQWWVLMILPPIGWVMIWLNWVSSWVGD